VLAAPLTWRPHALLRALVVPGLLLGGLFLAARSGHGGFEAGTPSGRGMAPALVLPDDAGGVFDLARQHGRLVLVTFGYTHCPDVCPATLGLIDSAVAGLGDESKRVSIVFVTLDPARDTAPLLHGYLANFSPVPVGLTGTRAQIAAASKAWGVQWLAAQHGAYFDHTSLVAVVAPDGREALRYGFSQIGDPASVTRDLRRILHDG
jgi:protein SCO1/2